MHLLFDINHICICRGYIAPEYVIRGILTEKADVYSFGALVIEVVSGKRNNAFFQYSHSIIQMVILFPLAFLLI